MCERLPRKVTIPDVDIVNSWVQLKAAVCKVSSHELCVEWVYRQLQIKFHP
jgi:hypothetical protein